MRSILKAIWPPESVQDKRRDNYLSDNGDIAVILAIVDVVKNTAGRIVMKTAAVTLLVGSSVTHEWHVVMHMRASNDGARLRQLRNKRVYLSHSASIMTVYGSCEFVT